MNVSHQDLDAICNIPDAYYGWTHPSTEQSFERLVDSTHYREIRPSLTESMLATHLREHPDLIEHWVRYSADKRTSDGWYFMHFRHNWIVGCMNGPNGREERAINEGPHACAAYIIRELDWLSLAPVE